MHHIFKFWIALQILLSGLFATDSAGLFQASPHSVTVEVTPQEVAPGTVLTVTVHMSTALNDAREVLDVLIPDQMSVVGQLSCTGACTGAGITPGSNNVSANFDVGSYSPNPQKSGTLTFSAAVSHDTPPGTHLSITAYLGSPAASDGVGIPVVPPPTPIPATLSLGVAPDGFIVGPDGSFIVYAYPFIPFTQGAMTEQPESMPEMVVKASVPKGLRLKDDSSCFELGSSVPNLRSLCAIEQAPDHVAIEIPEQEQGPGIFLHFENTGLDTGILYNMTFTLELPTKSLPVNTPATSVDIIAIESLSTLGAVVNEESMSVLVISSSAGCTQPYVSHSGSVSLAEWGGGPIISTSTAQPLLNAEAIAPFDGHCPTLIGFKDVKPLTLYIVGSTPDPGMGEVFCRACVLGTIPWSNDAIPIIKTWYDY